MTLEDVAATERERCDREESYERWVAFEEERRERPSTGADFSLVRSEMVRCREAECEAVSEDHDLTAKQKAELKQRIALREADDVRRMNLRYCEVKREKRELSLVHRIREASLPRMWKMTDGSTTEVVTLPNQRADMLLKLYARVKNWTGDSNRVECIDAIYNTVAPFAETNTKANELSGLLQREKFMLERRRRTSVMNGLRQRIVCTFSELLQAPAFLEGELR
eukprot:GHVU01211764.1.p1 GENE.GHVU01211764.1~~GHVU01211764.1.p1  ORF type:complete len:224 (+),score=39.53 GHVU01211764.1:2345-3016(+)